ncbi:Replication factor c large subunit [Pandoravirus kuranda]|uniref:Replication factor c large subunit n=1 Tax=Pandoravirus kuranda TaxID=3019033 RepID=A0AA95EEF8_9VIRU|nr:Replication factor c large subunit [Pandoravirus kuranda]
MHKAERLSPPSRRIPSTTQEWYALLNGPCATDSIQASRRTVTFRKSFYNDNGGKQDQSRTALSAASCPHSAPPAPLPPPTMSPEMPMLLAHEPIDLRLARRQQQSRHQPDALTTVIVPTAISATAATTATTRTTATRRHEQATERSALPLCQRTQPESPDVLLLERNRATELFRWVKRRAGKAEGIQRAAILMGPPGSGKTAAARVFLRAAGFQVVEFGPGSLSTECSLADQVRRVVQRKPLPGTRPPAVLIDDFDGLCAIDRDAESCARRDRATDGAGGTGRARLGNLVAVIAEAKASSPPIIVCSNDSGSAEVRLVREVCHETWFDAIPRARLTHLAKITAARQGYALGDVDAGRLADTASGDIRRLLNGLDLLLRVNRGRAGPATPVPVDMGSDTFMGNFGAVESLLSGRTSPGNRPIDCAAATDIYRSDPLLRRAMIHHNYMRTVADASGAMAADADVLDRISAIADNFAAADAMDYGIGVSGSAGGEPNGTTAAWRAGARAGSAVGWAHGANPATTILWAWTARTLAPRSDSTDKPDVAFCKPSSSDRAQYGEARDRIVCASAAMLPTASVAGAKEPLVLDFDLARAIFVGFATKTRADHAYESWSEGERKGVVDRMVWAGVTPEGLVRLLTWPCLRQQARQGSAMPPPAGASFAGRRTCQLLEDLKGRRQACALMGNARAVSMVMPSAAAMSETSAWPKAAPSRRDAPLASDAAPLPLDHDRGRKRKRPPGDQRADHTRPLALSSDTPAAPIPSFGRTGAAAIPRYRALSPSTLYRPPQPFSSGPSARRSAYPPRRGGGGAGRARRGGRGRGRP